MSGNCQSNIYPSSPIAIPHGTWHRPTQPLPECPPTLPTTRQAPKIPNHSSKPAISGDLRAKSRATPSPFLPQRCLPSIAAGGGWCRGCQLQLTLWLPKPEEAGRVLQERYRFVLPQSALWSACRFIFLLHKVYFYCESPTENLWSF